MDAPDRIRIDKWLWQARFCKSRAFAVEVISGGAVRVNGQRIEKPGRAIGPGDVLTLSFGGRMRLIRVLGCGTRRGPAQEALTLYLDLEAGSAVPPRPEAPEQAF